MKNCTNRIFWVFFLLLIIIGLPFSIFAANPNEPYGDPRAVKGGQITLNTSDFPKSFNYYINNASDAALVYGLVYDTLLELHPTTLEFKPLIAKSWTISQDKKEFTFTIDPRAKWADGTAITADDVKFTYDTIMNPKNLTSVPRISLSRFFEPKIIAKDTIEFTAKTVHYNNLVTLSALIVLPKHLYLGKDFNRDFNMSLPSGSGPYLLSEVKEGLYYTLTRRKDYWAANFPEHKGLFNFDKVKFKLISNDKMAFESFKKGDLDIYTGISAKDWVTETNTKQFEKNWIVKQKVYNYAPQGFEGLAFNMRRAPFNDIRVRQALFNLIDRKTLLHKIMFDEYQPLSSYWPSLYGDKQANFLVNYNPSNAKKLLTEAGYTRLGSDGYLVNSKGEKLEFTIIYSGETFEKHLTMMKDTWKQAGVKVNLQLLSWPTLIKQMEEYKFDAIMIAWSSDLFPDPEQSWHSKHADEIGGSNLPGYKNPKVDQLIDSLPPIFDSNQRTKIIKQIDNIIYQDYPYALFWGANYTRVLYKNIFGMPKTVLSKYGDDIGNMIEYWWIDPMKSKKYNEAVSSDKALPNVPVEVRYDNLAK